MSRPSPEEQRSDLDYRSVNASEQLVREVRLLRLFITWFSVALVVLAVIGQLGGSQP